MMKTTGTEEMKITGLSEIAKLFEDSNYIDILQLISKACEIRDRYFGKIITYSRKVFIPLTNICSNKCYYCNFRRDPESSEAYIMNIEDIVHKVKKWEKKFKIKEILVCTGERPDRYEKVRDRLKMWGFKNYIEYVITFLDKVLKNTEFAIPHLNIGYLSFEELKLLKPYVASVGLMLECISYRLNRRGMPHYESSTKMPHIRLRFIYNCYRLRIATTTGILVGICEDSIDRARTLIVTKKLLENFDNIQEIIIQPYTPGSISERLCTCCRRPTIYEIMKIISIYRIYVRNLTSIQSPPNLYPESFGLLILAGINDWGGISPITPDYINIDYRWPKICEIRKVTESFGYMLRERLPIYPKYIKNAKVWLSDIIRERVLNIVDEDGLVDRKYEGEDI